MQIKNTNYSYGLVAQILHWLIAILIFLAIVMGKMAEEMGMSSAKISMFVFHKSVGITVLVLVILRLLWKLTNPKVEDGLTEKQAKAASHGHWLIYVFMIVVPLSGWMLTSAANYPFAWMNLVSVPLLPVGEALKEPAEAIHGLGFYALAILIVGHVAMIAIHKRTHNLNVLPRILPGKSIVSLVAVVVIFAALLVPTVKLALSGGSEDDLDDDSAVAAPEIREATTVNTALPAWVNVADSSKLEFVGAYSGEPFNGEFKTFTSNLYFDPNNLQDSSFDVVIDATSVTTFNSDWDGSLAGLQWFGYKKYANAYYTASSFEKTENGFVAKGELDLKGMKQPVDLNFTWQAIGDNQVALKGNAVVNRTQFGIGSGSWAEDETIGFDVKVNVDLVLAPKAE